MNLHKAHVNIRRIVQRCPIFSVWQCALDRYQKTKPKPNRWLSAFWNQLECQYSKLFQRCFLNVDCVFIKWFLQSKKTRFHRQNQPVLSAPEARVVLAFLSPSPSALPSWIDAIVFFFEPCTQAADLIWRKPHVCADGCPCKVGSLSLILGHCSVCPWLIDFPFPTSTYDVAVVSHSLLKPCDSASDYLLWVDPSVLRVSSHHLRIMPNPTKAKSTQNPENVYFCVSNLTVDLRQIFVTKVFICTVKLVIPSYNLVIV